MKKLMMIIVALLAFSCKDEQAEPQNGTLTCKLNGYNWVSEVRVLNRGNRFDIAVEKLKKIDGIEVPWEILGFNLIEKSQDYQRLYKGTSLVNTKPDSANTCASFNTTQDDGDALCDIYEVVESDSLTNFIRITRQEGNYKEVWGEFSINFVRIRSCTETNLPDTLRIREGQLHVVLN